VLYIRVSAPAAIVDQVESLLRAAPSLVTLTRERGASIEPVGDVFVALLERDSVNDVVHSLTELGVPRTGCILIQDPGTWISERALEVEERSPDADNVVWPEVVEQAYEQSKVSGIFLTFMILATMLAAIAVITDSPILVVGAMVLGPEFMAVIALGLALVRRRPTLLRQAATTLVIGFAVSILATMVAVEAARLIGLVDLADLTTPHTGVSFIYSPNWWSFIVAVIAAAAGVLAITSSRSTGIIGVFISVTTIPASGSIAVAAVFGLWSQVAGSAWQLVINIGGMAIAGWLTLLIRQVMADRVSRVLARRAPRRRSARRQPQQRPGSAPRP